MTTFETDGITIAYDDIGPKDRGRPVILLHGFSSNRNENWRRVGWYGAFERLGRRFIAFDLRGHGESSKPHDPAAYETAALTNDIFALMDHLDVPKADLFGYSMGARLALTAALAQPSRVGDLILGGVGGRLFDPSPPGTPMADAMAAPSPDDIADPILRSFRLFADAQGEDRLALSAFARAEHPAPSREALRSLQTTTLIVTGTRDALAGDPGMLAKAIPSARAVALPGCDHFSAIPHGMFKATVFDFLNGELD